MLLFRFCLSAALACSGLGMVGCASSDSTTQSEGIETELFDDLELDESETVLIATASDDLDSYLVSPAVFDTVVVRVAVANEAGRHVVEALVKGSFPDACTELHALNVTLNAGGGLANLSMRRPESAICAQVVRPYRFFFALDEAFGPGSYSLVVNGREFAFLVEG